MTVSEQWRNAFVLCPATDLEVVERMAQRAEEAGYAATLVGLKRWAETQPTAEDDEAPLLNYRREELPEPAQAPLVPQGRQGEVTAPSWRGSREPGAPASWSRRDGPKKRSDAPRRTWDEVERDRNKSYGGMGRRR